MIAFFEICMKEWGATPEYIMENWTEELFWRMADNLCRRMKALTDRSSTDKYAARGNGKDKPDLRKVSNEEMFASLGVLTDSYKGFS